MKINFKDSKLNEYFENVEKLEEITSKHKFTMWSRGFDNNKRQYNYTLVIDDKKFNYFEGSGNKPLNAENKNDKIINALWCILSDYSFKDYSISEMMDALGYDCSEAKRILNAINRNSERLEAIFTDEEMEFLYRNINL